MNRKIIYSRSEPKQVAIGGFCEKNLLTEMRISARISYRKGVIVKQRSASVICVYQKSNLTLAGAVAFLMPFITLGLPDTDYCDDDTDDRHYNTDKFQNYVEHQ